VTSADSGEYWCRAKVSGRSDGYIQSSSTLIVTGDCSHNILFALVAFKFFETLFWF